GKCLFHVTGDVSTGKVFKALSAIHAELRDKALPVELPSWLVVGKNPETFPNIPILLVIAYSRNARLSATCGKQHIEMSLQGDMVSSLLCETSEEADQWQLDFTPNHRYISEIDLGRNFKRECFRRACSYSDALTIRVRGHEMHEFSGTYTWLFLVAPYPYWKKTANIRTLVHKQFDIAVSFRPGTERRYEIFCAGHLSGGQPQQLLEHAFESYIAEYYGEEAVPKVKDLGYVAVLSVLGLEGIVRPSMASEDCLVPEESELYSAIKDNLRSTFRSLESLRDLLKEAYGLEPLADRSSDGLPQGAPLSHKSH
ncbi:MAG: hypothetical protein IKS20_08065, partial [Victivallales bacterium]|nr:hypothetical protein [Victivallales bacterium]